MLNKGFQREILTAAPSEPVTAVVSFAPEQSGEVIDQAFLQRVAEMKQPVIEMLQSMEGVHLSVLPGMPHTIAVAPAREWRALIERVPWLDETNSVRLDPNEIVATTLRD